MKNDTENSDNSPPVFILLPICIESKNDEGSHIAKRPRRDVLTDTTLGDCLTNKDTTSEVINNLTIESLRMVLDKIQRDVNNLTQLYRPINNTIDDPQLVFLKIITEKDVIIGGLNKTLCELREENNSSKSLYASLSGQAESNNAMMSSLQKGLDANYKLYVNSETEKAVLQNLIDKLKETISTKEQELETAKIAIAQINRAENVPELMSRIATFIDTVAESAEKNGELEVALSKWKTYGIAKDKELEKANERINELQTQSTSSSVDSAIISDLNHQVATLNQKLKEWTVYAGNKERELEESKLKVESLHGQLKCMKCEIDSIVPEMTNRIQGLQSNLESSTQNGMAKDKELEKANERINELQTQSTSSSVDSAIISDLNHQVATLNQKLKEWTVYAGNKERELDESKLKVESLHGQLKCMKCEIYSIVPEMTNRNQGLQSSLDSSTHNSMAKDEELEKAKELTNKLQTQLKYLRKVEGNDSDVDGNICEMRENECLTSQELLVEPLIPELSVAEELNTDHPKSTDDTENFKQISKHLHQSEIFKTDDPTVEASRDILMAQRFGWIRFNSKRNCRAWPGFVYPPDEEGLSQAQQILSDGYVTDTKKTFFHFDENIPEEEKGKIQVKALKKFNEKFKFNFV